MAPSVEFHVKPVFFESSTSDQYPAQARVRCPHVIPNIPPFHVFGGRLMSSFSQKSQFQSWRSSFLAWWSRAQLPTDLQERFGFGLGAVGSVILNPSENLLFA